MSVLAIGITQYKNVSKLEFSANDARSVAKAYREVGGLSEKSIKLLVDDEAQKPNEINVPKMESAITAFLKGQTKQSTAVLFFAGHGFRVKSDFYLVGNEFSDESPEATGLPLGKLRSMLMDCQAKTKVVILDCCHSGSFGSASTELATTLRSVPGCVAITASRPEQESLETSELRSGVFTHWLVRGMRGDANAKVDGRIDAMELFDYVSNRVSKGTDGMQAPAISLDQSSEIPTIIELRRPDRPSDTVGIIPFPLPPTDDTMLIVLDTVARLPDANPRRTIGLCHWVLKHATPQSEAAKQASQLIKSIDDRILSGKIKLGPKEEGEQ